ncbi:MAG: hypothetical protein SCM96_01810 [Acidobacteriota bacterium]|nr:hypothetical protein [Acidobacteriota bacterium]
MAMSKKAGAVPDYECRICGSYAVINPLCGCAEEHLFICCGENMQKKTVKKAVKKVAPKKAAVKKAVKKAVPKKAAVKKAVKKVAPKKAAVKKVVKKVAAKKPAAKKTK